MDKDTFLLKYNIQNEDYATTGLEWSDLEKIFDDYIPRVPVLEKTATTLAEILRDNKVVHSVRARVKDPNHLIEKIIRKTLEKIVGEHKKYEEEGNESDKANQENKIESISACIDYQINVDNYLTEITDLIGIRILHLYKDQAFEIDKMIRQNWELLETPIIYYRDGDNTELLSQDLKQHFNPKPHKFGYRSWHYLIKSKITKDEYISEIQVRTIFEEGWSEIDHQLRYPYHLNNQLLKNHLLLLNRLAGSADEMVNNIRETIKSLDELELKETKQEQMVESLQEKIETVYKEYKVKEEDYNSLKKELDELQKSQKIISLNSNFGNMDSESFTGNTLFAPIQDNGYNFHFSEGKIEVIPNKTIPPVK